MIVTSLQARLLSRPFRPCQLEVYAHCCSIWNISSTLSRNVLPFTFWGKKTGAKNKMHILIINTNVHYFLNTGHVKHFLSTPYPKGGTKTFIKIKLNSAGYEASKVSGQDISLPQCHLNVVHTLQFHKTLNRLAKGGVEWTRWKTWKSSNWGAELLLPPKMSHLKWIYKVSRWFALKSRVILFSRILSLSLSLKLID